MKTLIYILLNLFGIAIFFLIKFLNRSNTDQPSLKYWAKDNMIELIIICLFDAMIMLMYLTGEININFVGYLPDWLVPAGAGAGFSCAMIGLVFSWVFYSLVSFKIKEIKK